MEALWDVLGFAGKSFVVFVTFAACVAMFFSRARRSRDDTPTVRLREIGERWRRNTEALREALDLPVGAKPKRRWRKKKEPALDSSMTNKPRVYVIDFKGDVLATGVVALQEQVNIVLGIAQLGDEVVVRLESPGGAVHGYGLASSQLARLRAREVPLTICVDKVAASGGYMMACVGSKILAAPFAIVGSIGVVAQVPNVHRLLEKFGVDYQEITAGKYKRTVSMLGPITEEGRAKFKEQIEETHGLFKRFVRDMRPRLDVEAIATGEHWYGAQAIELGLIDEIKTSDDYLLEKANNARVFEVICDRPISIRERALSAASAFLPQG
jgi:serine protease SohB